MLKRFGVLALGIVGIAAGGPLHAEDEVGNGFYAQGGLDIELSDKFEVSLAGGGGWNQGPHFYVNVGIGRFE